jgi:RNA 2',3'-cyclic 3'-phosphodiesterase
VSEPEAKPTQKPPRLFVAVWPSDNLRVRLIRIVDELKQGHEGVNWLPPDSWHVTLAFLGRVTGDRQELVAALREVELAPVMATAGPEIQMLGRHVLCVPVRGLEDMAAAVREATAPFAETPETRPFFGHITLARLGGRRHGQRRRGSVGFVRQWLGRPVSGPWLVDELSLTSSNHTPQGSFYYQEWLRCFHPGGWVGRLEERTGLTLPPGVNPPPGYDQTS